jgi:hypothetical protein
MRYTGIHFEKGEVWVAVEWVRYVAGEHSRVEDASVMCFHPCENSDNDRGTVLVTLSIFHGLCSFDLSQAPGNMGNRERSLVEVSS